MSNPTAYLRDPHLHGEEVVFVADDDVWVAPLAGGRASRLTADRAPVGRPRFSPNGSRIAFDSTRDGRREVYVLDREAGTLTRLTWWGRLGTQVAGWVDDTHVLIASDHGQPFGRLTQLYSVALDGSATHLPYGTAMRAARHPGGAVAVVTPNSRDAAMWKRYRGGTASKLWLDASGDGQWQRLLPDEEAGVYSPSWVGGRLVFCSDLGASFPDRADEQAQLWSVDAQGGDLRQHTHHSFDGDGPTGYVRDATSDGTRVVYHARGSLYLLEDLDAEPRRLDLDLGALAPAPVRIDSGDQLDDVRPDAKADASLVDWRGAAWWLTHRGGPARQVLGAPGVRVREPRVLADTGRVVAVTDAEGEDALEVASVDGLSAPRRLAAGQLGRVLHLEPAPDGASVATVSHDGAVRLVDLDSGQITDVGLSDEHEAVDLAFSPDGRYLVWAQSMPASEGERHCIMCVDRTGANGGPAAAVALTSGRVDDRCPVFTRDGKNLVFLSARTFDPAYTRHSFELSFTDAVRPWLVPLRADDPAPFGPSSDGWPIAEATDARKDAGDAASDAGEAKAQAVACEIDVDGFEERMVAFPVASGDYTDLQAAKDGVLWIRHAHDFGELGAARAGVEGDSDRDVLERYSLTGRELVELGPVDSYRVSGDGERVVVRDKGEVLVWPATHKVDDDESRERIRVDLDRLGRDVDRRAEWRQMFEENGRLMRDHYWRADMDGVDWDAALAAYRPVIDRISTSDDLLDVLWETVGELNTSHSYVALPAGAGDDRRRLGHLGADLREVDGGVVIERILPGESSDPDARSPLRAAGVAARPGDRIVAIAGRPVSTLRDVGELLQGSADRVTELTLATGQEAPRRVVVVPLADEEVLRYQAWVAERRERVESRSGGRLGYLHVPDMVATGWAQLHRLLEDAMAHEAVVVDVRYNRGGHTSQLVLERLQRRIVGWDLARHSRTAFSYPAQAPRGPLAFVCNQWSGSDGDIVNAAAQEYRLGPVIGERTWGGVIGIDGRYRLVDGTGVTQPRYAHVFHEHGWSVENHGVDPDIEVVMSPADWESGEDPQLDRAVAELLDALEKTPAATAPSLPEPRVRRR